MRARRHPCLTRPPARGFAYLSLLILIAVIGIAATASLQVGAILQRRVAEEELLQIGLEFRNALVSYANTAPGGLRRAPATLADLLKDPRYPNPRRHLRKIYADPLTGKEEWGILRAQDGVGIAGIYSLATSAPIKVGNFEPPFQAFEGAASYRDWLFTAVPVVRPGSRPGVTIGNPPLPR